MATNSIIPGSPHRRATPSRTLPRHGAPAPLQSLTLAA